MTHEDLERLFRQNDFTITPSHISQLFEYEKLLLEWNKKVNLVSRKSTDDLLVRHIFGSIAFLFRFGLTRNSTLLDVGTGGGLPGIPLAILMPNLRVTLVDSIRKKTVAVEDMIGRLGLTNVTVICGRVEEFGKQTRHNSKYDYIVARGVGNTAKVIEWCEKLLSLPVSDEIRGESMTSNRKTIPRGSFIFLKGGDLSDELAALRKLRSCNIDLYPIEVTGLESVEALKDKKLLLIHF